MTIVLSKDELSSIAGTKVLVSTSSFGVVSPVSKCFLEETCGLSVTYNPFGRKLSEDESVELYSDKVAVLAGTEKISSRVVEASPLLRVISRCGVGVDAIDATATARAKITVVNTPSAHVDAVAELTLAGILNSYRDVTMTHQNVMNGVWKKPMGRLLAKKKVGFVGFGQVAQRLATLLHPFGVSMTAVDLAPDVERAKALHVEIVSLESLLEQSDVVSIHVPGGAASKGLIGIKELKRMKTDAMLVNTARGGIIDEIALDAHLSSSPDFSAYLDTFESEPYSGPLLQHPRLLVTAHIGSYAREARIQMELEAAENLVRSLIGEG